MFKEHTTDEILRMIDEDTKEREWDRRDKMEEKYQVEITKIVNGEKVEYLLGDVNSLDELIENIDSFVERMKPLPIDLKTSKLVDEMLNK